jgi:hypothetical protein
MFLFIIAVACQIGLVVLIFGLVHHVNVLGFDATAEAVVQCKHFDTQQRVALLKQFELTPVECTPLLLLCCPLQFLTVLVCPTVSQFLYSAS